ncbi:aminopeptidase P family protein [Ponticoccus sp. SC2-23]|uniref:M24 family metallopeptidase n=1 Tax=Alexandriicola marinus TaxID=2081710 RepID=UPI000FD9930D|nr:Xaa-Pro peptidase family protein [Alexandriicola marinus]MBM1219082.1 aminopeptidase P family protein [Ponticoccus sp. SC6-9]MBM1223846.1 aminopeptidase P family protein [Ponticoccus sp. SC6-15]MBM1228896.1 aminopeptidase P family protein [Ponticoccus sp. SC6-38]MBM1232812.1 aminopeptidase P family protein [Ponticoccus sp. SC6-45]MBM1237238.1 aminopeptidase P family protein [Ponticoccus sp. SC6-49]MBM1241823.1 aminopeptidase P family protein [Ponticoccus sp. SC2-64]MBM1246336.1 aminopepti
MTDPSGFAPTEYQARCDAAQQMMDAAGLDALLLTTEADLRYFSGFLTRFWESPTRPWFLILPAQGKPVAVIPEIGAHLMGRTWIDDIRTWRAPDYSDDGVSLLAGTLHELAGPRGRIGLPSGMESHLGMPLADFRRLERELPDASLTDDAGILRALRLIKSPAEMARIEEACAIGDRAFSRVPEIAGRGVPLSKIFRDFQRLCLEEGADFVPYLAGGAGQTGYGDVISPATDLPLEHGDMLMLDTGLIRAGYFCDFNRNFCVGPCPAPLQSAHDRLIDAVTAGAEAARPGALASDIFAAMDAVLTGGSGDPGAGRYGHGLGMQLTEWPSILPADRTGLRPGMVLTLEPSIATGPGTLLVHEEVIAVTDGAARFLTARMEGPVPALP